jgi:hypothetical protein
MAKLDAGKQPDYSEKQRLFFGDKVNEHDLRSAAALAEDDGIISDALDLFGRLKDTEALRRLQVRVQNEGDCFLFEKAAKLMGETPDSSAFDQLGECALQQGKLLSAKKAFELSGNESQLNHIEKLINETSENHEENQEKQDQ